MRAGAKVREACIVSDKEANVHCQVEAKEVSNQ